MCNRNGKVFFILIILVTFYGCSTANREIEIRSYWQEKERLDQNIDGNAGYIYGTPQIPQEERKKTRKIFTIEFSKEAEKSPYEDSIYAMDPVEGDTSKTPEKSIRETRTQTTSKPKISIPSFDDAPVAPSSASPSSAPANSSYVEYFVTKDDTLQKISKKFYDSYSKWPRIYDANRSLIKDPNFIKPGITIRIPMEN